MKSIRSRLVVGVFALIVTIFAVFFLLMRNIHQGSFERTEELTDQIVESFLMNRWEEQISSLATMYADQLLRPVYSKDLQAVSDLAGVVREQGLVTDVFVLDNNSIILSDGTWESLLLGKPFNRGVLTGGPNSHVITTPIKIGTTELGSLVLGFNTTQTNESIRAIHNDTAILFRRQQRESDYKLATLFLAALLIGLCSAFFLSRSMTRPLRMLAAAIEKIGRYEYDIALPQNRQDEIGDISRALYQMANTLRSSTVSKMYLEQVLANMPVGVAITDTYGRIEDANPRFYDVCGRTNVNGDIASILGIAKESFSAIAQDLTDNLPLQSIDIVIEQQRDTIRDALLSGVPLTGIRDKKPLQFLFVIHDITERKGLERKLRHLASHDHLTGLPNRRQILQRIEKELDSFRKHNNHQFWLVFVDLDGFKDINDTHGHHVGDRVLQAAAKRLHNVSREDDVVGRLSGDEFLLLLRGDISSKLAMVIAQRILHSLSAPIQVGEIDLSLTASIGLACSNMRQTCADDIINEADTAMYKAKMTGKNRIISFNDRGSDPSQLVHNTSDA